jgi:hypothetical protein
MRPRLTELLRAVYPASRQIPLVWDQALLRERAPSYFRRNVLAEACVICADFLWPGAPLPVATAFAFLSVVFSLTTSLAAIALAKQRESLIGALLGRGQR